MKRLLYALVLAGLLLQACKGDEAPGKISLESDLYYVSSEQGSIEIAVDVSGEWLLEYPSSITWLKTDIRGGRPGARHFTVSFEDNPYQSLRYADIRVFTRDRASEKTVRIMQYPRLATVAFSSSRYTVRDAAAVYSMPFTATVDNENLVCSTDVQWLSPDPVGEDDTSLRFTVYKLPSTLEEDSRTGHIYLSYTDQYERVSADTLTVKQISADPAKARLLSFAEVRAMVREGAVIEDNVCVEGWITANGTSDNYTSNIYESNITGRRYIIENEDHETIIFESDGIVGTDRFDKVRIWLLDLEPVEYTEGSFSYKVLSGFDESHTISREAGVFEPRKVAPGELNSSMVFSLVTITNVEIAALHGAFTNFKETSPSSNATSTTHTIYKDYTGGKVNWLKSYPEYFRFYPTILRGANGRTVNMYVSPAVSWAHESYPQGSGEVTGIVVREVLKNFDIDETSIGIRPLERSDIALKADRADGITSTLVDFEFNCMSNMAVSSSLDRTLITVEDGVEKFLPNIQQSTSSVLCTFTRDGAEKIGRYYSGTTQIGFQDKFRGDFNPDLTNGYNFRDCGTSYQVPANTRVTFSLDHLCTTGINSGLSLQIEVNANKVAPGNPIRARVSYSLDGKQTWHSIENSEIKFLSQFDRDGSGESGNRENTHIPGMKWFDVSLPDELCNQEDVCLKIEQTASVSSTKVVRIGNLTIKYNKQ